MVAPLNVPMASFEVTVVISIFSVVETEPVTGVSIFSFEAAGRFYESEKLGFGSIKVVE